MTTTIILENFKCYENRQFVLGKEGVVHIAGPSGVGKSSILEAIKFVLFPSKGGNVLQKGKKKCRVTLNTPQIEITRSRGPNRLIAKHKDITYEDDAAQGVIETIFPKEEAFLISSYIDQNLSHSFLMKRSIDQLEILEQIAFDNIDIGVYKEKIDLLGKDYRDELKEIRGKINILEEITESIIEEIDYPLQNSKQEFQDFKTELIDDKKQLNMNRNDLEDMIYRYTKQIKIKSLLESENEKIKTVESKLLILNKEKDGILYIGDEKLEELNKSLRHVRSQRKLYEKERIYNEKLKTFQELESKEIDHIKTEKDRINSKLWKTYDKNEAIELSKEIEEELADSKEFDKLNAFLSTIEKINEQDIVDKKKSLISLREELGMSKLQKNIYSCPSCNTNLCFRENCLFVIQKDLSRENNSLQLENEIKILEDTLKQKEKQCIKYNNTLQSINEIKDRYENLKPLTVLRIEYDEINRYINNNNDLEKELLTLVYSKTLKSLSNEVESLEKEITMLKQNKIIEISSTEEELQESLSKQTVLKNTLKNLSIQINDLIQDKENAQEKYNEYLVKYINIEDLEKEIDVYRRKIKVLEEKIEKNLEIQKNIDLYISYLEKKNERNKKLNELTDFRKREKKLEKNSIALDKFKTIFKEAESEALLGKIEEINNTAKLYLDYFFKDDPISVIVYTVKERAKGEKVEINLRILYKEVEMNLNNLSGGERNRVIIAFTLALNELFHSPILMIDEATSSLNQELAEEVIEAIKDNCKNKLIVVIAHQCVTGIFDRFIELN